MIRTKRIGGAGRASATARLGRIRRPAARSAVTPGARRAIIALCAAALLATGANGANAQQVRVSDLTIQGDAVPVRLMGYGLVMGLDGSGDRAMGGRSSGHTVQSVANLLRRFDIEVPAEALRTRNVAAVLVTAEVSPYLRPGGRFEIHISSVGDARSLRGGVLWVTPLVADVDGFPVASAQGPLLISEGGATRGVYTVETTARVPTGGVLEANLPRQNYADVSRLLLKQPELGTATRIAAAINAAYGGNTAMVEDPGSIALQLGGDPAARMETLAAIADLQVQPVRVARVVIDSRDGTVVGGGDLRVGEAVVSHGLITLSIGGDVQGAGAPGDLSVPVGTTAQQIASALHAFQTPASEIAAIFESLREVGALAAEVTIR